MSSQVSIVRAVRPVYRKWGGSRLRRRAFQAMSHSCYPTTARHGQNPIWCATTAASPGWPRRLLQHRRTLLVPIIHRAFSTNNVCRWDCLAVSIARASDLARLTVCAGGRCVGAGKTDVEQGLMAALTQRAAALEAALYVLYPRRNDYVEVATSPDTAAQKTITDPTVPLCPLPTLASRGAAPFV
eukprot:COSAG05_NODE_1010_length_6207_cov_3.771447_2_plen_185_part_00